MELTITQKLQNGLVALQEGKLHKAVIIFTEIIKIKPKITEVHFNLGVSLQQLHKLDEAKLSYKKTIELNPNFAEAYNNLGVVEKNLGKFEESEANYRKAVKINPNFFEAHNNLGNILQKNNKLSDAEESYRTVIALNPNFVKAHYNLGNLFHALGKFNDSEKCYRKALELKPNYAEAYSNLGNALEEQGQLEEALSSYAHAITLKNDIDYLFGHYLHLRIRLCIWLKLSDDLNKLINKINSGEKASYPFPLLSLIDDPDIHKKSAEIYLNDKYPKSNFFPKISNNYSHQKIKIGYFSADFWNHPVAYLTSELYEIHDRKIFEIYAFSFGRDTNDEFNNRIKKGVDHFIDTRDMTDIDVVRLARSLEIDIAIDLGGYTRGSRQAIFAMSVAPIQVSYLGYAGTMGGDYIDYLIADRTIVPKKNKKFYSEKIVYLPNNYMVSESKVKPSKRKFIRKDFGLPIDGFVFCCFNNAYKITPNIFIRWMKILAKVDGSVLWLSDTRGAIVDNLKKEAQKNGIDKNRLIFASPLLLREDYLSRITLADLFIDTLPFNAHATASDTLRMGVPLITCPGKSFASRVAASLLNTLNLPELITSTLDEYESLAIELAKNPEKLKNIKDKLLKNLSTSPLYDTSLFAKNLEVAYLAMYKRFQDGLNPDDIEINY